MKKITAILVAVIMLFASLSVSAGVVEDLNSLGVLPEGVYFGADSEELITREEFAYITAKIMSGLDYAAKDTVFADVKADNPYSGYIDYLKSVNIVSGTDGAAFNPKAHIEVSAANKMIVSLLGFGTRAESASGYPEGYNSIAAELRLYKNVAIKDKYLTRYDAATLIHNALMTETMDDFGNKSGAPLASYLKINAYDGEIINADTFARTATFRVDDTEFATAGNYLANGETIDLVSVNTVNVADYERLPATVWVNESGLIVNIIPRKNVEVKYGYVYSVNGDLKEGSSYLPSKIDEIIFTNEEEGYDVSDSLVVKYNDAYTEKPVKICKKFIKAVIIADEIKYIESWDIKHGGIIESIGANDITYTNGTSVGCKFEKTVSEKKVKVFLNNTSSDLADLKADCVFDYYAKGDVLVIIASEKYHEDYFNSYSDGQYVEIGNTVYDMDGDVYTSKSEGEFIKNTDIHNLLNKNVRAHISPAGYVKYIVLTDATGVNEEFYGVITGINREEIDEYTEFKMLKINASTVTEEIYPVSKKVKYLSMDGSVEDKDKDKIFEKLEAAMANKEKGASLYVFRLNNSGEIINVKKPTNFYGTSPEGTAMMATINSQTPYLTSGSTTIRLANDKTIMYVYKDGKDLKISPITWSNIIGRTTSNTVDLHFKFYGEGKEASPDLVLMFGTISTYWKTNDRVRGIYIGRTVVTDEEGEQYSKIKVITTSGVKTYTVTKEVGDNIDKATGGVGAIYYAVSMLNSENDIHYMSSSLKLASTHDEWLNENSGLKHSVIEKVAGDRVYLENGEARYLSGLYVELNEGSSKNRFSQITRADIKAGDEIFYTLSEGLINITIVVR